MGNNKIFKVGTNQGRQISYDNTRKHMNWKKLSNQFSQNQRYSGNQWNLYNSKLYFKWKGLNFSQLPCNRTYINCWHFVQIYPLKYRQTEYDTSLCITKRSLIRTQKKNIILKELMRIKDICKHHLLDHYMLTPWTIKQLGIKINGLTIEAYTQAQPQEIRSFTRCVLS